MPIHQVTNSLSDYNYNAWYYDNCEWYYHFHTNYELLYVEKGMVEVQINEKNFEVTEGKYLMVLPNQFHSYRTPESSKVWVGVFSSDYVRDFHKTIAGKTVHNPIFECEEGVGSYLKNYLIKKEVPERYILKSCLYAVCNEFLKNAHLEDSGTDGNAVSEILKYLSENFSKDITMKELAKELGYEYHYFSRIFHKNFDMNFRQLVNIFKMSSAIEALMTGSKSITEIAVDTGFASIRNFNRVFLKHTGCTPLTYRNKAKK